MSTTPGSTLEATVSIPDWDRALLPALVLDDAEEPDEVPLPKNGLNGLLGAALLPPDDVAAVLCVVRRPASTNARRPARTTPTIHAAAPPERRCGGGGGMGVGVGQLGGGGGGVVGQPSVVVGADAEEAPSAPVSGPAGRAHGLSVP